jgi:hypothetical protein
MLDVLVYAWRFESETTPVLVDVQWHMLCVCADEQCACNVCLALLAVFEQAACIGSTQTFATAHEIVGSGRAEQSTLTVIAWASDAPRVVAVDREHAAVLGHAARSRAQAFRHDRGVVDVAAFQGHGAQDSREAQGMVYTRAPKSTCVVGERVGRGWRCQRLDLDASRAASPALHDTNLFCDGMMAMEHNRHRTKQRNLCTLLFCGAGLAESVVFPVHFTPPLRSPEAQLETVCWYNAEAREFQLKVYKHGKGPHHLCRHVHVEQVHGAYQCTRPDLPLRRHKSDGVFFSLWPWSLREVVRGRCPATEREWGVCATLVGDAALQRALNVLSKPKLAAIAVLYNPTRAAGILEFFARRGGAVQLDADAHMQLRAECDAFWFSLILECRPGLEQIADDVVTFVLAVWRVATGDSDSACRAHNAAQKLLQWHRCALEMQSGPAATRQVLEPFETSVRQTLVLDLLTTLANVLHKRGSFFHAPALRDTSANTRDLSHVHEPVLDFELEARGLLQRAQPAGCRRLALADDLRLDPFSGCEQAWGEILALREKLARTDATPRNAELLRHFRAFLAASDTRCTGTRVRARVSDDKVELCTMLRPARRFLRQVLNSCSPATQARKRVQPEPVTSASASV